MLFEQRHHPVIEQIGCGDRRLAIIELGKDHLAVGIDKRLLIDPSHALERSYIERYPELHSTPDIRCRIPRAPLCPLWLSPKPPPEPRSKSARPAKLLVSKAFSRFLIVSRSWRSQTQRTPAGEIKIPCFLSSLATRTCPHAGSSIASFTTAFSIVSPIRFLRFGCSAISRAAPLRHRSRKFFEPVKTVPAISHHSARLGHVAQLLAEFQKPHLGLDHFICRRHFSSLPFFSSRLTLRTNEDLTSTVRFSLSTYKLYLLRLRDRIYFIFTFPLNSVVFLQVHSLVQARDLLAVAVKHQSLCGVKTRRCGVPWPDSSAGDRPRD